MWIKGIRLAMVITEFYKKLCGVQCQKTVQKAMILLQLVLD